MPPNDPQRAGCEARLLDIDGHYAECGEPVATRLQLVHHGTTDGGTEYRYSEEVGVCDMCARFMLADTWNGIGPDVTELASEYVAAPEEAD